MLTAISAGSSNLIKVPFDYAGKYAGSKLHAECLERIQIICENANDENKVIFSHEFATSMHTQAMAVMARAFKVYFRSPSYNLTRIMVSGIVALLFGSVYASQRVPSDEADMNSRVNSILLLFSFSASMRKWIDGCGVEKLQSSCIHTSYLFFHQSKFCLESF